MYSASSGGQYNLQFDLSVINQTTANITPELVLICVNSGIFTTEMGTSSTNVGILTREVVLETKNSSPALALDTNEHTRIVGGKEDSLRSSIHHNMIKPMMHKADGMSGGGASGGGASGGGASAGAMSMPMPMPSNARKARMGKLHKYLAN